jgi:hypothetical protein
MSCGPAKYVKFRHRTLLFYAKQIGSDRERGKPLPQSNVNPRRESTARAGRRCSGLMGFSGLRFSLLGVFEALLCGHYYREARPLCGEIRLPP